MSTEQQAMTSEQLRQAIDDSVLTHTGRSIGDVASQRVIEDIWPLIEAREAALRDFAYRISQIDLDQESVGSFWRMQAQARALLASAGEAVAGEQQQGEE